MYRTSPNYCYPHAARNHHSPNRQQGEDQLWERWSVLLWARSLVKPSLASLWEWWSVSLLLAQQLASPLAQASSVFQSVTPWAGQSALSSERSSLGSSSWVH